MCAFVNKVLAVIFFFSVNRPFGQRFVVLRWFCYELFGLFYCWGGTSYFKNTYSLRCCDLTVMKIICAIKLSALRFWVKTVCSISIKTCFCISIVIFLVLRVTQLVLQHGYFESFCEMLVTWMYCFLKLAFSKESPS